MEFLRTATLSPEQYAAQLERNALSTNGRGITLFARTLGGQRDAMGNVITPPAQQSYSPERIRDVYVAAQTEEIPQTHCAPAA